MSKIYAAKSPEITRREIDHMALSRELAGECVVLLENDGVLPLAPGGKLALFGVGARLTVKGGTGSGDVNTRDNINIERGLKEAGYVVTTAAWMDRQDAANAKAREEYFAWVPREAREKGATEFKIMFENPFKGAAPNPITMEDIKESGTDTAVYVISRNSGEGADRYNKEGDYLLFPEEKEQLILLGENYKKLILVLNIGGIMDMSEIRKIPGIGAVLLMSQLGNIGGLVLGDVLTGKVNPSGKLTDTWAKKYSDYPSSGDFSHNDGNIDDEYYTEGIYVGYRYFDTFDVEPMYPFGYGLSYTDFTVTTDLVTVEADLVKVSVTVENTGRYAGQEVVQVYVSAPKGKLAKPYQELAAFKKTGIIAPGERETMEISFAAAGMASYCEACAAWVLEAGSYIVRVGNSSRNTKAAASIVLSETVKTQEVKNLFADSEKLEEIIAPITAAPAEETPVTVLLDPAAIPTEKAVYQGERREYTTDKKEKLTMDDVLKENCTVEELTSQLTIEEMADFCVGTLRAEGGSIVGNASYTVPGAAGDTSAVAYESRGIKNMILADGPAGLRLQPVFKTTKEGRLLPGGEILGDMYTPFDPNLKEEEVDTWYQYCTAIPIGWALAQSWNMELLEKAGSMVGEEMELFGVDLWLAPALNIHRNPLCGRNFEYYSEDPYVSGKAAAAITRGVQAHPGKGTTIKHFAANNQEDNRYFTNSHISERAIREIYIKGFEIAIKESQPLSIMTSYNLLNGVHTANCYDLLQAAARDEWGFEGTIMTDWFTSQDMPALTGGEDTVYPISASTGCIKAGNDMQMPGCIKNVTDIIEAVKTGREIDGYTITKADLQYNAANVIRVVAKTTVK